MTDHIGHDNATMKWLSLADNLVEVAQEVDSLDPETLSRTLSDLREALGSAVSLFQANGGISLAERANLHHIMEAQEPTLLPSSILKEGLLEGGQQLWAIASLLRVK